MKARLMKVAGLLLAAAMAFTAAYTNQTKGQAAAEDYSVRAGVSNEFSLDLASYT